MPTNLRVRGLARIGSTPHLASIHPHLGAARSPSPLPDPGSRPRGTAPRSRREPVVPRQRPRKRERPRSTRSGPCCRGPGKHVPTSFFSPFPPPPPPPPPPFLKKLTSECRSASTDSQKQRSRPEGRGDLTPPALSRRRPSLPFHPDVQNEMVRARDKRSLGCRPWPQIQSGAVIRTGCMLGDKTNTMNPSHRMTFSCSR